MKKIPLLLLLLILGCNNHTVSTMTTKAGKVIVTKKYALKDADEIYYTVVETSTGEQVMMEGPRASKAYEVWKRLEDNVEAPVKLIYKTGSSGTVGELYDIVPENSKETKR